MLKIFFDTNILHQEGLQSARMQVLQRLIKANEVQLILSELVIEEYRSKRISNAEEEFQKIINSIEKIKRNNLINDNIWMLSHSLQKMYKETIKNINDEIDDWIINNGIEVYNISKTCIEKLFKDYFQGNGAFREKKKKDDIPDAVIFDAIESLARENTLYVIVKDIGLIKAIEEIKSVKYLNSLEEFLKIEKIKKTIESLNKENSKIEKILLYLNSIDCNVNLASYYEEVGMESLSYKYEAETIQLSYEFDDIDVKNTTLKATVTDDYDDFLTSNASYLGNNKFSLTYRLDIDVDLSFLCTEEAYETLPYKIRKILSSNKDPATSFVKYSGVFRATYNGVIILSNIDEELTSSELKVHFSYLGTDKCEITCEDSVESVYTQDYDLQ